MSEIDLLALPPFSGRDGACPKCGCRCAETSWLVKPIGRAQDHIPRTDEARQRAEWFTLYWVGGSWDVARRRVTALAAVVPAAWYPDEWLGRHCLICKFRWDEQLAEQENADV